MVVPAHLAVAGAAIGALLAACSFTNPATTATPYAASDGTNAELQDAATGDVVRLRNFLAVSSGAGSPGTVVGSIVNGGSQPVTVRLTVLDANQQPVGETSVDVSPRTLARVGPRGTTFDLPQVPSAPGANLTIQAATSGGSTQFTLPVLPPFNEYATLTPTVTPTTESASPSASPTESLDGTATQTP